MTGMRTALRALATVAAATALLATAGVSPAPAQARPGSAVADARSEPKAPDGFVALRSMDPTIIQEMRYTTAHTDDPRIQGVQRANRQFLKRTLTEVGFGNLPEEWWHFTHGPELFPDTYFDFPVDRRSVGRL